MRVYSTRKFATLFGLSVLIALIVAYGIAVIVPSIVPAPNPSVGLSKSPSLLRIVPGASGTYSVSLRSENGFSGLLKLATSVPNAPNSLKVDVYPQEVSVPLGGSANVTLNVATNPVTPAGTYSIVLNETSQSSTHTDTVPLNVVGFTVSANPTSITFPTTSTGKSIITVTSVNGFSGQINLFASSSASGPTVNVSPNTADLPQNGNVTSVLTVQSSAQGRFDVTVTVTGNQSYQSVTLPVTATSSTNIGDFNITTIPTYFSINPGNFRNVIVKVASLNGCDCLVTISVPGIADFAYGISPYIVEVPPGGTANSTLTLSAGQNSAPGTYQVTVTGTTLSASHSTTLNATITTQPVADMSLQANPNLVSVKQGSSNSTVITIQSITGFSGTVSLTSSFYPTGTSGIALSLNPVSVQLSANGVATSNLTITAAPNAPLQGFNFTVTATSGTLSRAVYANFQVIQPSAGLMALSTSGGGLNRGPSIPKLVSQPLPGTLSVSVEAVAVIAVALTGSFVARAVASDNFCGYLGENRPRTRTG